MKKRWIPVAVRVTLLEIMSSTRIRVKVDYTMSNGQRSTFLDNLVLMPGSELELANLKMLFEETDR